MACHCRVLFVLMTFMVIGKAVLISTESYFRARVADGATFPKDTVAIFNEVEYQIGVAYDNTTGIYTAPVSALYQFMLNFQSMTEGFAIYELRRGNEMVMSTSIEEQFEFASFTTIIHVDEGVEVTIKRTDGTDTGPEMFSSTQLAGYLLRVD